MVATVSLSAQTTVEYRPEEPQGVSIELPQELKAVAQCESGGKHFDSSGQVLRGKQNPKDVGLLQINETYHLKTAQEMGIDIYTEEGNKLFGLYLYKTQGLKPWRWSKYCWEKLIHNPIE